MGALAPLTPWIPEDDILLKSAVEAGASLESLAKGAVQFSRRFTVRELQDRWHSLLYDPVVSAEASTRIIDFERFASNHPSKFNRFGSVKETKCISKKRNSESVRSCYYALRKRICNEPFNPMDLSFLVGPNDNNYVGNSDVPNSGNCIDHISNNVGIHESDMDVLHCDFPENLMDRGTAEHAFHTGLQRSVKDDFPLEPDNIHEGIPHILVENQRLSGNDLRVKELGRPESLSVQGMFKVEDLGEKLLAEFDQMNRDNGNICSEIERNEVFNSPLSDCGASFQNLEYSSPLGGMPIWRTFSAPDLPVDVGLREKDIQTGATFELPGDDDVQNTTIPGYVVHSDSKLNSEVPHDHLKSPMATTEGYLAELSNSLLNLANEDDDLLFIDVEGKDMIEKSYYDGLSSLLLHSPNDVNQDQKPCITTAEASCAPDAHNICPTGVCSGELCNKEFNCGDRNMGSSEVQLSSSASALNAKCPELSHIPICCTLNTEDPEIPDNDDVFLQTHLPLSIASSHSKKHTDPICSSVNSFSVHEESGNVVGSLIERDKKHPGESHASSQRMGLHVLPEIGQSCPIGECKIKFEADHSESNRLASRSVSIACGSGYTMSENVFVGGVPSKGLKEETKETSLVSHFSRNLIESPGEKAALHSDNCKSHLPLSASGIKQEPDVLAAVKDHQSLHAEAGSVGITNAEPSAATSNQKGISVESEEDVPYFSDVEAMILDMDLDPDDQDLHSSEEVSRYLHEDTKKAIVRLEQGVHSYMQRAIASHGAFAVLYGRHSKHYIKKTEVLIGRATEDVLVDIDLGREGRANKISRRQATIILGQCGSFYLRNLGKCSISLNNKDIAPGHSLTLSSSCLIEIRGMSFIFEINEARVRQYLNGIAKKSS